ncbi:MAG: FecR domain-containing protein [Odoribacter splanchnicus]
MQGGKCRSLRFLKDGLFDFEGMKLEDLAVELSRWYDVDFFIHAASGQKNLPSDQTE